MDSCFSDSSCGGDTAITSLHPDIITTHILKKLDGPTLAAASCVSPQLQTLCSGENLWKNICNSNFPSTTDPRVQNTISKFSSGHRSFFSDSFSTIDDHRSSQQRSRLKVIKTHELISAVDIHCGDHLVYSKVLVTDTSTGWFSSSPLWVDLVDRKEFIPTPVKFDVEESEVMKMLEKEMKLSWIIIDPTIKRAINLSSHAPVEVRRHWLTGDIEVRYGTVMAGAGIKYGIKVTCGGKEGGELHVREISMQVDDLEGKVLNGRDSLVNLHEAMEGRRAKWDICQEKKRYENYLERKRKYRENKLKSGGRLDMGCMLIFILIFITLCTIILF